MTGFNSKREAAADKLQEDLLNYGTAWSQDGKRIDPMSVYKEQPAQEPVAWEQFYPDIGKPQIALNAEVVGYVAPQRQPLTDEEIDRMYVSCKYGSVRELARAIEAAHGIKGEA